MIYIPITPNFQCPFQGDTKAAQKFHCHITVVTEWRILLFSQRCGQSQLAVSKDPTDLTIALKTRCAFLKLVSILVVSFSIFSSSFLTRWKMVMKAMGHEIYEKKKKVKKSWCLCSLHPRVRGESKKKKKKEHLIQSGVIVKNEWQCLKTPSWNENNVV